MKLIEAFTILIFENEDNSITREVTHDGKIIYSERFVNFNAWFFGGGNPVLDLFEKRFLLTPKERENISRYRCHIGNSGKGIRRVLSKLLNLQSKLLNRLFKHGFFSGKAPDS